MPRSAERGRPPTPCKCDHGTERVGPASRVPRRARLRDYLDLNQSFISALANSASSSNDFVRAIAKIINPKAHLASTSATL